MIIEIVCIVVMLGLLVYWHVKNPDSLNVTLSIEKELLANDNTDERDDKAESWCSDICKNIEIRKTKHYNNQIQKQHQHCFIF